MKKTSLVSLMAVGLALIPVIGALAATNPAALNPTPTRESKPLADFETPAMVTSDPDAAGVNLASINMDPQFVAEGTKSLKLDLNGVSGWHDAPNPYFSVQFAPPIDIKGYQVLSMDVYLPADSLSDPNSYYQFFPRTVTTDPNDPTKTVLSSYTSRPMHPGWNHLIWDLQNGTDTMLSQLYYSISTGAGFTGPIYVDNIRVYKGTFVGLKPDEKLIFGFDDPKIKSAFTGDAPVDVNTDAQFVSQGAGSLKVDLTGQTGGNSSNVARADDLGVAVDVSNATAIHLDVFIPAKSQPTGGWKEVGFGVVGDGGSLDAKTDGYVADQWNTLELPLTPDQAKMLGKVKGVYLLRNEDPSTPWNGPIYIDALRAVFPTQ